MWSSTAATEKCYVTDIINMRLSQNTSAYDGPWLDTVLVIVMIRCVFIKVVIELKIYYIYKAIFRIIKLAVRNLLRTSNFIV
jgi:hypothetical protein